MSLTRSLIGALLMLSSSATAQEVWLYGGYGPQPGESGQQNQLWGVDWLPYHYTRSERQVLSIGVSYSHLTSHGTSDPRGDNALYAVSIFPQLTLIASPWHNLEPVFQVRALGPTYLSDKRLGGREQAMHFAFQAQVSAGLRFGAAHRHQVSLVYRHYSNANLDKPNDGLDVPFTLAYRVRF
ncbi:acyloxyacyl hydrolase [Ferrimonas balearica]|uniref:acyloxyacyl hydrolase n=1 Tax=Ferrimonas balearica TaxID=44012 RepID=UPI001C941D33|nr:acyloxyacyl hydrolase [Ferrimonas balearica]